MAEKTKHTFKTYFFTGILVTAPVALTFYLVIELFKWVDASVIQFIPEKYNPETYLSYGLPGLGILLLVVVFVLIGMLATNILGRWLMSFGQRLIEKTPVISGVYSALKKLFETLLGQGTTSAFRKAVLVEYPRKGVWTIAFITTPVYEGFEHLLPQDMVTIYVPTTPNPTSGFMLYVPKKEIKELDMRVDDAFKLLVSTGIVTPSKKIKKPESR